MLDNDDRAKIILTWSGCLYPILAAFLAAFLRSSTTSLVHGWAALRRGILPREELVCLHLALLVEVAAGGLSLNASRPDVSYGERLGKLLDRVAECAQHDVLGLTGGNNGLDDGGTSDRGLGTNIPHWHACSEERLCHQYIPSESAHPLSVDLRKRELWALYAREDEGVVIAVCMEIQHSTLELRDRGDGIAIGKRKAIEVIEHDAQRLDHPDTLVTNPQVVLPPLVSVHAYFDLIHQPR
jgi:hypothetical protein